MGRFTLTGTGSTTQLPVQNTSLNKIERSKMGSASTLVKCGLLQLLCAVPFLFFKIFGNNVTFNYKESVEIRFRNHAGSHTQSTTIHLDAVAIVLYTITGLLLCYCWISSTKKLRISILMKFSLNISIFFSLFLSSGLFAFALVNIFGDPKFQRSTPWRAIFVNINSLVMLSTLVASTVAILRDSFCRSNDPTDDESLANQDVRVGRHISPSTISHIPTLYQIPSPRNRASGPPGPPQTTTLHVSNERDVAPSQSTEDDLFQDFMTAGSEEEQHGEAPPPYHVATGRIPCKHCRFTATSQKEFIEHFQRRPDHWSCLGCKRRFTTFKDFYRHVVRRQCNQSGLSASQCF